MQNQTQSAYMNRMIGGIVYMAMYFRVTSDYLLGLDERRSIQISFLSDRYVDVLTNLVRVMEEEKSQ